MIFKFKDTEFIFDDEDSYLLEGDYVWSIDRSGHLRRGFYTNKGIENIAIHRLIMNVTEPNVLVDHKDRNPRNNMKSNLRITDHLGNSRNASKWSKPTSSKYKGVSITNDGMFLMSIRIGIDNIRIRERYSNEDIAGYVYNLYAIEYFGEFSSLNDVKSFTQEEIELSRLSMSVNEKTSRYKGVSWRKGKNKWLAQFYHNKKRYRVGQFDTEEEAYRELTKKKNEMGII